MGIVTHKINYDTERWPFAKVLKEIIGEPDLYNLEGPYELFKRETDQLTVWHKRYYDNGAEFLALYRDFVREVIKPLFPDEEKLVFQRIPTFRVQLRDNVGVGAFHRDRDYNHTPHEINFHLPFTDTNEQNSIWLESEEGKEDYTPQITKYGELLVFDGCNLKHGNKVNTSPHTRVSVDFRVIPFSQYEDSDGGSVNMGMKFKIGEYFDVV